MSKIFYNGERKANSKGSVSLLLALSILIVMTTIALGSSFLISSEIKLALNTSDSVIAYYASESAIEQAMFDISKNAIEPAAVKCSSGWVIFGNVVAGDSGNYCALNSSDIGCSMKYCLKVTNPNPGDFTKITAVQAIGEYKSARRSIEITELFD